MTDIEALKKLVMQSTSLGPDEKETLLMLIPSMQEDDLEKLFGVFSAEQGIIATMPQIINTLDGSLEETFSFTEKAVRDFKKKSIMEAEKKMRNGEVSDLEDKFVYV